MKNPARSKVVPGYLGYGKGQADHQKIRQIDLVVKYPAKSSTNHSQDLFQGTRLEQAPRAMGLYRSF